MYDFIKISYTPEDVSPLFNSFDFTNKVNRNTGELSSTSECEHKGMIIKVVGKGLVLVLGSPHKYLNNGGNYNDFTLMDFIDAVEELSGILNYNLWLAKPDTVEFGVNIEPPIQTKKLLRYCMMHGNKPFKNVVVKDDGDYHQVTRQQYLIKLYDKSLHYKLPHEILRFEIKLLPGKLRKFGLNNLYDLLKPEVRRDLGKILAFEFKEILFQDPTIKHKNLTQKQKTQLNNWKDINYWIELIENTPHSNKNKPSRELDRFRKLIADNSDNIQYETQSRIVEKWGILSGYSDSDIIYKLGNFNTSIIELIFPNKRLCEVTRLDISMQRKNSCFLAQEGVRYYYDNSPEIYDRLKKRLSTKWSDKPIEKQFYEIAHSVRNEYFNKIHNTRKRILGLVENPVLFSLSEMVENKYLIQARI